MAGRPSCLERAARRHIRAPRATRTDGAARARETEPAGSHGAARTALRPLLRIGGWEGGLGRSDAGLLCAPVDLRAGLYGRDADQRGVPAGGVAGRGGAPGGGVGGLLVGGAGG